MAFHFNRLCILASVIFVIAVCQDGNPATTPSPSKKFPDFHYERYTTYFEISIINKRYSLWAKETYDMRAEGRAKLEMSREGWDQTIIMDFDRIFTWTRSRSEHITPSCKASAYKNQKTTGENDFGRYRFSAEDRPANYSTPHFYATKDFMEYFQKSEPKFINRTNIDGIDVDHWIGYWYWSNTSSNFTVDMYVTTDTFTPFGNEGSDISSPVPVRAEIKGTKSNDSAFHHIYNYMGFAVDNEIVIDNSYDVNVQCEGKEGVWRSPGVPTLTGGMQYSMEKVSRDLETSTTYYDTAKRLIRIDSKHISSIYDFNTDTHLYIFKNEFRCSATNFSDFNDSSTEVDLDKEIPLELTYFLDDGKKYVYQGEETFRGLKCIAFIKSMMFQGSEKNVKAYFWKEPDFEIYVPVGFVVTNYTSGPFEDAKYWYHHIFMETPKNWATQFDISSCRKNSEILEVAMTLSFSNMSKYYSFYEVFYQSFISDILVNFIAVTAGVSPIQVYHRSLDVDPKESKGVLYCAFFDGFPNKKIVKVSKEHIFDSIKLAISKGDMSNDIEETDDGVFAVTVNGIKNLTTAIKDWTSHDALSFFHKISRRTVIDFKSVSTQVSQFASDCANICKNDAAFECRTFKFCKSSRQCVLSEDFYWEDNDFSVSADCDMYVREYTADFLKDPGYVLDMNTEDPSTAVKTVEDCAKACLEVKEDNEASCNSFDYCSSQKKCYLSKDHGSVEAIGGDSQNGLHCEHWNRHYLHYFKEYAGHTLKTSDQSKVRVSVGASVEDCARDCMYNSEYCTQFSFCSDTMTCQVFDNSTNGSVESVAKDKCYTYKGKRVYFATSRTKTVIDHESTEGYTAAVMTAVAVSMVVVGMLLGLLTLFVLGRFPVEARSS